MKKGFSLVLVFIMLILCACSEKTDNQNNESSTTAQQTTTAVSTTKKAVEYFDNWGSELVPEDFPKPPTSTHSIEITAEKASNAISGYSSDWIRITFICLEYEFYVFANSLKSMGYNGGFKNFKNTTYYPEEFIGFWQNGKNIVKINHSEINEDNENETIFTLDIIECSDNFPKPLLEFFPKFDGYSVNEGIYCGHNKQNENETTAYEDRFLSHFWHLEFRHSNSFVGVDVNEIEKYYTELEKAGFINVVRDSVIDGCTITEADFLKETDGYSYGVFTMYNHTLKTFDIIYTNNSAIYLGE